MISKYWISGLAAALLATPALTVAAEPATHAKGGAAKGDTAQTAPLGESRYDLAATNQQIVRDHSVRAPHATTTQRHRTRAANTSSFGNGQMTYVEGPSFSYRPARRGPLLELGALGGGSMEDAPFLAHLGVDWKF